MTTEEKAKRIDELLESIKSHSRLVGMYRELLDHTLHIFDYDEDYTPDYIRQHHDASDKAQKELMSIINELLYK